MKDKILVELHLPAINKSYDVYLPKQNKVGDIILLLIRAFSELSEDYFRVTDDTILCDKITGTILDINITAEELGLHNGSKLMLI